MPEPMTTTTLPLVTLTAPATASVPDGAPRSARDRVFAAADALVAEDAPLTVTTVRERAGCSNATATTFLRQWREERAAAEADAAALPPLPRPVTQVVQRGLDALWREAVRAARGEHTQALGDAQSKVDVAREEADRLASALDAVTAQRDEARAALTTTRSEAQALRAELAEVIPERDAARADVARRSGEADALREALHAAQETGSDLQERLGAVEQARSEAAAARAQAEASAVGLREALTDARAALDQCRTAQEQARVELERTRAALDEARAVAAQATAEQAVAESARAAEAASATRLEAELTALREEVREARQRAAEAERSLAAETAARARSDGEVAGWRARHAAAEDGSR